MKAGVPLSSSPRKRRRYLLWAIPLAGLVLLFCANLLLQTFWAHRHPAFFPDYDKVNLTPILAQSTLSAQDYDTLFLQTGLSGAAVDDLLFFGQGGIEQIIATQEGFFTPYSNECVAMLPGRFTTEDLILDEQGSRTAGVPLALVQPGDILLSFSTHTFGWRHGHAGLVTDAEHGITLEAVVMGSDSAQLSMQHWRTYSNFMLLRIKDATAEEREQVVKLALEHLDGIPYGLTSGVFGVKAPDLEASLRAQCSYLPWYAWQAAGYDLDSDGGRIVTVGDLAASPLLEVVQVYGMKPEDLLPRVAS